MSWVKDRAAKLFRLVGQDIESIEPRMHWDEDLGVGWYPIASEDEYSDDYFDKYSKMEATVVGSKLNDFRTRFVDMHYDGHLVDIGVGSGTFIKRHGESRSSGYDVGSKSIQWLKDNDFWLDPYSCSSVSAISCWDSFEHIRDYRPLVRLVSDWVFMSIPIFKDKFHAENSKHFRPTEHWWYFTHDSLISMMQLEGFKMVSYSVCEQVHGREDIVSYAFMRV